MNAPSTLLAGEVTIYRAAELKTQVMAALVDSDPLAFDLSGVTEIDTSGVQLLLLAGREAAALGRTVDFVSPSPAVSDAFALLELGHLLSVGHAAAPAA